MFTHDNNGNMVTRERTEGSTVKTTAYSWDSENRLVGIDVPLSAGPDHEYTYDGFGRRVGESVGSHTRSVLYDGAMKVRVSSADDATHWLHGPVGLLSAHSTDLSGPNPVDADSVYFMQDVNGSVVALADTAGVGTDAYAYGAFGDLRQHVGLSGQEIGFVGNHALGPPTSGSPAGGTNPQTGLADFNARPYDPALGRFLSEDPADLIVGIGQSHNRYNYGWNSPWLYPDPTGELPSWMKNTGMTISHMVAAPSVAAGRMLGFDDEQIANGMLSVAGQMPIARQSYYLADNWAEKDFSWGHLARTGLVDTATIAIAPARGARLGGALYRSGLRDGGIGALTGLAGGVSGGDGLQGAFRGAVFGVAGGQLRMNPAVAGAATGIGVEGLRQIDHGCLNQGALAASTLGGASGRTAAAALNQGMVSGGTFSLAQSAFTAKAVVAAEAPFIALGGVGGEVCD